MSIQWMNAVCSLSSWLPLTDWYTLKYRRRIANAFQDFIEKIWTTIERWLGVWVETVTSFRKTIMSWADSYKLPWIRVISLSHVLLLAIRHLRIISLIARLLNCFWCIILLICCVFPWVIFCKHFESILVHMLHIPYQFISFPTWTFEAEDSHFDWMKFTFIPMFLVDYFILRTQ